MQKLHLPQEINLLKLANKSFAKYYHGMPGLQHVLLTQNEPHFLLLNNKNVNLKLIEKFKNF